MVKAVFVLFFLEKSSPPNFRFYARALQFAERSSASEYIRKSSLTQVWFQGSLNKLPTIGPPGCPGIFLGKQNEQNSQGILNYKQNNCREGGAK